MNKERKSEENLDALTTQGSLFDRATLNAMLEKLAKAKPAMPRRVPMASCYSMEMESMIEEFHPDHYAEYICPKCGTRTRYAVTSESFEPQVSRLRHEAESLRELGLDIKFDESELCMACATVKPETVDAPVEGVIKKTGAKVEILYSNNLHGGFSSCYTILNPPLRVLCHLSFGGHETIFPNLWVAAKDIDENGNARHTQAKLFILPKKNTIINGVFAHTVRRLAELNDNPRWVRIANEWHEDELIITKEISFIRIRIPEMFAKDEDVTVTKKEPIVSKMPPLCWIINGIRIEREEDDYKILTAFLTGKKYIEDIHEDVQRPTQIAILRLRKLLGLPPLSPKDEFKFKLLKDLAYSLPPLPLEEWFNE